MKLPGLAGIVIEAVEGGGPLLPLVGIIALFVWANITKFVAGLVLMVIGVMLPARRSNRDVIDTSVRRDGLKLNYRGTASAFLVVAGFSIVILTFIYGDAPLHEEPSVFIPVSDGAYEKLLKKL